MSVVVFLVLFVLCVILLFRQAGPFMYRWGRAVLSEPDWRWLVPPGVTPPDARGQIEVTMVFGQVEGRGSTRLLLAVDQEHLLACYCNFGGSGGLLLDRSSASPIIVDRSDRRTRIDLGSGRVILEGAWISGSPVHDVITKSGWTVDDG